jgi:hypothetical protein
MSKSRVQMERERYNRVRRSLNITKKNTENVYVCVCVCVREREREKEKKREREREHVCDLEIMQKSMIMCVTENAGRIYDAFSTGVKTKPGAT